MSLPSQVIWGADFDSDIHFALRRLEIRSWNHRVIKDQWRHMTRKWFFDFLTHKNHPWIFKNIQKSNVFYSLQGTRCSLKFCSSSMRSKVIGDHGVSWLFGTWPDLRCDWLTYDLKFIYQSLRLANGAQSALWAEINRQLTRIRVRRILRAARFERFVQWTTSNITDWLIFLLMLALTVTFADVGARNRQARVQNYGHCCAYNFRTFPCKYWLVTSMKIEPVVIIIIRIEYSIQKMFKSHLPKAISMILEVFIFFSQMTCLDFYRYSGLLPSYKLK